MALTITLFDGTEHTAEFSTVTAALPLIKPMLRDGEDFSLLTGDLASAMLFPRILSGLGDTDFIKDLASGLLTLFPTLPTDKVWANDSSRPISYGVAGLEITEIFMIISKVLESVNNSDALNQEKVTTYIELHKTQTDPQPIAPKALSSRKKAR